TRSVNEAIKLKVILNDNRIEKVILPSQPDSLNELISTLKEKLHLKFDFSLLYEDPDFNNELFNFETVGDLPSPRATVKVLRIRRDTDLGLAGVSATELQAAPPERFGRWPEVFVIPTFSMEVEFALREGNCAYLRRETVLKITRDQKHNILDRWLGQSSIPKRTQVTGILAAEALVTKHPCLKEPGSKTGCDGWKNKVAVNGGRRSNIKQARRAEVNFLPNFPQGEDEASLEKQRLEITETCWVPQWHIVNRKRIHTGSVRLKNTLKVSSILCRSSQAFRLDGECLLHCYFQIFPEMLDQVQVQALAGPLKDIQRLVPKPLLRCLGCVLRVIDL
uniref:Uncharacterized protein n=1 Tax=Oncorhynchus tshawytscha TaxID=74940 RepID=A0AAZ3NYV8_ONCTS